MRGRELSYDESCFLRPVEACPAFHETCVCDIWYSRVQRSMKAIICLAQSEGYGVNGAGVGHGLRSIGLDGEAR